LGAHLLQRRPTGISTRPLRAARVIKRGQAYRCEPLPPWTQRRRIGSGPTLAELSRYVFVRSRSQGLQQRFVVATPIRQWARRPFPRRLSCHLALRVSISPNPVARSANRSGRSADGTANHRSPATDNFETNGLDNPAESGILYGVAQRASKGRGAMAAPSTRTEGSSRECPVLKRACGSAEPFRL